MKTTIAIVAAAISGFSLATPCGLGGCPANRIIPSGQLPTEGLHKPVLFLPIAKSTPDVAYSALNNMFYVTPGDVCTYVEFLMDSNAVQNKTLNLIFNYPSLLQVRRLTPMQQLAELTWQQGGRSFMEGPGHFQISAVQAGGFPVEGKTTWNNQPHMLYEETPGAPSQMVPGNSYIIASQASDIPPNIGIVKTSGRICSPDTTFYYIQGEAGHCTMGFYFIVN